MWIGTNPNAFIIARNFDPNGISVQCEYMNDICCNGKQSQP